MSLGIYRTSLRLHYSPPGRRSSVGTKAYSLICFSSVLICSRSSLEYIQTVFYACDLKILDVNNFPYRFSPPLFHYESVRVIIFQELSLKNLEDFAQVSNHRLSNHEQNEKNTVITKVETERGPDEKRNSASKKRNKIELERLLNRQFLIDTLSKCSLNAASANTVSKQMGMLQSALSSSYKEIESLRELREKLRSVRREDFNLLSEIVRQLRVASENDEL